MSQVWKQYVLFLVVAVLAILLIFPFAKKEKDAGDAREKIHRELKKLRSQEDECLQESKAAEAEIQKFLGIPLGVDDAAIHLPYGWDSTDKFQNWQAAFYRMNVGVNKSEKLDELLEIRYDKGQNVWNCKIRLAKFLQKHPPLREDW